MCVCVCVCVRSSTQTAYESKIFQECNTFKMLPLYTSKFPADFQVNVNFVKSMIVLNF